MENHCTSMESNNKNPWLDMGNPLRRVINPNDGKAFKFERKIQYCVLVILCAIAILVMLIPSTWFDYYLIQSFCSVIKNFWPKLQTESSFLDGISPFRGTRHILMHVVSTIIVMCVLCFYSLSKLRELLVQGGTKLTEFHKVNCIVAIFLFFCVSYLHFIDTGFITSTARASRGIGRSQFIWFWTALQSTFLMILCHFVFGMYIKLKKFRGEVD
jgi:hypothetical protein